MNFKHIFLPVLALVICSTIEIKASKKSAKKNDCIIINLPEGINAHAYQPQGNTILFDQSKKNAQTWLYPLVPGKNKLSQQIYLKGYPIIGWIIVNFSFFSSGRATNNNFINNLFGCTIFNPVRGKKYTIRPLWVMDKNEKSETLSDSDSTTILFQKIEKESALKTPEYYQKIRDGEGLERLTGDYCREGEIFSRGFEPGYYPSCYTVEDIDPSDLE